MKRVRLLTVVTALAVIGIFAVVSLFGVEDDEKSRTIKVGFVYDGDESAPYTYNFIKAQKAIDDHDFGGMVTAIAKSNIPEEKVEEAIKELIDEGCDLIFTTSYGYQVSAKDIAKEYPDIQFCQATGDNALDDPLPNYHTFMGEIYQGRYITGIVAGMKLREMIDNGVITSSQAKLGYVGAFPYAEVISGYTAFILGVRSIVPEAVMEVRYTDTWTSYTLEKKCAQELIDDGCVIISQHSDTIGPAAACEAAADQGKTVYHVGYNQSMIDVAPTTTLVSSRIDWSQYIFEAVGAVLLEDKIEDHVSGNIHGNDVGAGFEQDWVQVLEINNLIAADGTEDAVNKAIEKFKKNQLKVFVGDYVGVDPKNPNDTIDLNNGYDENKELSAPSFHYILKDVIEVVE
ncbi:MAG: BMP family ABC transporter substrate-binding protein [Lachnospiraceae bacterium]|nr:BMP family ABC transporter substrate-binding protein [Lachnospiraceae bacterium]